MIEPTSRDVPAEGVVREWLKSRDSSALASRISLFENMVGGLQPILSAMSKEIGRLALSGAHVDVDAMISTRIDETPAPSVDIDEQDDFGEMPEMGMPTISVQTLLAALSNTRLLPAGYEVRPLNEHDFAVVDLETRAPMRATLSRGFYAEHYDHTEFWTPDSPIFPSEGVSRHKEHAGAD